MAHRPAAQRHHSRIFFLQASSHLFAMKGSTLSSSTSFSYFSLPLHYQETLSCYCHWSIVASSSFSLSTSSIPLLDPVGSFNKYKQTRWVEFQKSTKWFSYIVYMHVEMFHLTITYKDISIQQFGVRFSVT